MATLNINSSQLVKYTNQLEKLHRSGVPIAVRNTLSALAMDVKQRTMPKTSAEFQNREKNFFKANSRVEFAKGFDIKTMQSAVGFSSAKLKGGDNYAVKDLEKQEHGGAIGGRAFVPLPGSRVGRRDSGKVKSDFRIGNLKNVVDATKSKGKSRKQRFIKSAFMAKKLYGNNAFVLGNPSKGKRTLSRIDEITKTGTGLKIRRTAVYSYEKGRTVKVTQTGFMKRASMESRLRTERVFVDMAEKQLKRLQLR